MTFYGFYAFNIELYNKFKYRFYITKLLARS